MPVFAPIPSYNLHIGVETMLQCGGSCAGCVLSSMERTTHASFDVARFERRLTFVTAWLKHRLNQGGDCESITVFFGPGDHFLMNDDDLDGLVQKAAAAIPQGLHARTTCFISASAVGKTPLLHAKAQALHQRSRDAGLPFFVQTVFDPQKFQEKPRFAPVYVNNIQGFRQQFGMTEIAINLSGDIPVAMPPSAFHAWMIDEGFRHVEFAWLPNERNVLVMQRDAGRVVEWLLEVTRLALNEPTYEINLVPLLARAMLEKGSPLLGASREGLSQDSLVKHLNQQLYIDAQGMAQPALGGVVGNQLPLKPRGQPQGLSADQPFDALAWSTFTDQQARSVLRTFVAKRPCATCEWRSVCANHGAFQAVTVAQTSPMIKVSMEACPFDFKGLLDGLRELFVEQPVWPSSTRFDRNPLPWTPLEESGDPVLNASSGYFQQQFFRDQP